MIDDFATAPLPSEQHVGTALASAEDVRAALDGERWKLLGVAIGRAAGHEPGFTEVVAALRDAVSADEFAIKLEPAVAKAYGDAVKLIGAAPAPVTPPVPPPPVTETRPGVTVVRGDRAGLAIDEARTELDRLAQEEGEVQVDLRWTITTKTQDA